jgi:hypothetical protein
MSMRNLEPAEPGQKLVITDSTSMFYGEIGTVANETSPFPDETVWLVIPGWPSMSWSLDHVRPATIEDEARCAARSGHEEGSAPQDTDPAPFARTRGARGVSEPTAGV